MPEITLIPANKPQEGDSLVPVGPDCGVAYLNWLGAYLIIRWPTWLALIIWPPDLDFPQIT